MSRQMLRSFVAILSVVLFFATPVNAEPISIREVVQIVGSYQKAPELRLGVISPGTERSILEVQPALDALWPRQLPADASGTSYTAVSMTPRVNSDSLPVGIVSGSADSHARFEKMDLAYAEGVVCDCGEIAVPGNGVSKWPLLFLAAIPLVFIDGCDNCETSAASPVSSELPEPASLLLLGSGLAVFGVNLRRRYAKQN